MKYGVAMSGKNPYKQKLTDPDWIVQPLHHNLTRESALSIRKITMEELEYSLGDTKNTSRLSIFTFNHALEHADAEATQCPGCVAALNERYDMLQEESERAKGAGLVSSAQPSEDSGRTEPPPSPSGTASLPRTESSPR